VHFCWLRGVSQPCHNLATWQGTRFAADWLFRDKIRANPVKPAEAMQAPGQCCQLMRHVKEYCIVRVEPERQAVNFDTDSFLPSEHHTVFHGFRSKQRLFEAP
jgi:hypothetical protein